VPQEVFVRTGGKTDQPAPLAQPEANLVLRREETRTVLPVANAQKGMARSEKTPADDTSHRGLTHT